MFTAETLIETPSGVRPVHELEPGDPVLCYRGEVRPLPVPVRRVIRKAWDGPVVGVQTSGGFYGRFSDTHPLYGAFRTTRRYFDLFLVERVGLGCYLGLANGAFRDQSRSPFAYELVTRGPDVLERLWLLRSLEDEDEAVFEENWMALEAGLPTFDLDPRIRGVSSDSRSFVRLLEEVPTRWRARRLMARWGLREDRAHFERKIIGPDERSRFRFVEACLYWNVESPGPEVLATRHRLETFPFTPGIRANRDRVAHLTPGGALAETFEAEEDLRAKLDQGRRSEGVDFLESLALPGQETRFFRWDASYLRPGLKVPRFHEGRLELDEVERVDRFAHQGDLIGLELDGEGLPCIAGLIVGRAPDDASPEDPITAPWEPDGEPTVPADPLS